MRDREGGREGGEGKARREGRKEAGGRNFWFSLVDLMFPAMNKENAPYVLQEEFAGSPTILKPLASKDYEYFQSQTEQMEDYGASPFYDQFNEIGVDDRCNGFDLPDKGEKAFRDLYCLSQRVAEGINNGDAGLQEVKGPIFMKRKFPRKYRSK